MLTPEEIVLVVVVSDGNPEKNVTGLLEDVFLVIKEYRKRVFGYIWTLCWAEVCTPVYRAPFTTCVLNLVMRRG